MDKAKVAEIRAKWPAGEWDNEEDYEEFEAHGLLCVINRHGTLGHLCGYVRVEEGHPLFEVSETWDAPYGLEVHYGVTYTNGSAPGRDIPDAQGQNEWWIGFDCAHLGDVCPGNFDGCGDEEWYKDFRFVRQETESLAKQLAGMA